MQQQQPYQQQATRTAVSPGVGSSTITKPPSAAAAYVEGTPTSTREYDNKYSESMQKDSMPYISSFPDCIDA